MSDTLMGSASGMSPSDPPFAQLSGETSGGWKDKVAQIGAGLVAGGNEHFKRSFQAAGDMASYQKRRDMGLRAQGRLPGTAKRHEVRSKAEQKLHEFGGE